MKKVLPKLLILLLIVCLGTAFYLLYEREFAYSSERSDLDALYGVTGEDDYPIILNDAFSDLHARKIDGACYMEYQTVREMFNERFYYGAADGVLVYCLAEDQIATEVNTKTWTDADGKVTTEEYMPAAEVDGTLYLALDFVQRFANFEYEVFEEPNRIRMYTEWPDQTTVVCEESTQIREFGGIKSLVVDDVEAGEELVVIQDLDDWIRVITPDAMIGYLESKTIGNFQEKKREPVTTYSEEEPSHLTMGGKVNMAWNAVSVEAGNDLIEGLMENTKSINVLAPTWLTVTDENGSVSDISSAKYVKWAHDRDIQVWAVLDNFNTGVVMSEFLATRETRGNVIDAALRAARTSGCDGINLDFESLGAEDGENFVQFVRELSIACRRQKLFLSIDNYVPYGFNDFYDLEEQAWYADYVVIMGYDEHFAGSGEPGSVASIGYVDYGITEAMKEVPAERLINGMPFYTRVWSSGPDGVDSFACGMADAQAFVQEHGLTVRWGNNEGQNYAEGEENGILYQVWLEDAESIGMKLAAAESYGIAGVAEWKLGMETPDIWDVIEEYVNR